MPTRMLWRLAITLLLLQVGAFRLPSNRFPARVHKSASLLATLASEVGVHGYATDLEALTVSVLKDRCRDKGLRVGGSKADLIARLAEVSPASVTVASVSAATTASDLSGAAALSSLADPASAPQLDAAALLDFERNGHCVTRGLFTAQEVSLFQGDVRTAFGRKEREAWVHSARIMLGDEAVYDPNTGEPLLETSEQCREALEARDIPISFLQVFNSWRDDKVVEALCTSPRLARTAAQLLGVPRVRLYQDAMFMKRPNDGPTAWHSDLLMAPFDTNKFVTCWVPLDEVPSPEEGGTGLVFASGSHVDFALPFWSNAHDNAESDFSGRYQVADHGKLKVGDATWHHGWTLHSAPPNDPWHGVSDAEWELADEDEGFANELEVRVMTNERSRLALAVSFVADGARLQLARDPAVLHRSPCPPAAAGTSVGSRGGGGGEEEEEEAGWGAEGEGGEGKFYDEAPSPLRAAVVADSKGRSSYEGWLSELEPGAVADHPLLPVVWDEGGV
mmetsp:Transcript_42665/g.84095  ORF Transcript_42665/g.84095 Transcript_42665/m.84095 type:complete len:506 (-) Transcript_42665:24-1541(-)